MAFEKPPPPPPHEIHGGRGDEIHDENRRRTGGVNDGLASDGVE